MKKLTSILLGSILLLASCSNDNEPYLYDMYLAIEVVDAQGNDLLGNSSTLIHEGETNIRIGGSEYYLNSKENKSFKFKHIQNGTHSYIKIGSFGGDQTDTKVTIDWGGDIEKDVIVFSYDSPVDGLESSDHDPNYPYSITINGKEVEFNEERGHFIYVKDINL